MKKIWCLLIAMFLMTGCASKVEEERHFITESIENENTENGGCVIVKEHEREDVMVSQTLCPGIQGVSSVRVHNPYGEVIVDYEDGTQKKFTFEDADIDIEYITKTQNSSTPCIIRSDQCVYVYDSETAEFQMIADDFLFYLEDYQNKYYYVNTDYNLVDIERNIYCTNVVGVKADSNHNNTTVYVHDD